MDHDWVMRFIKHRIADRRVQRHIKKWLKAGVLEDGAWRGVDEGVPQGGSVSPMLANVYLHYALDLWVQWWRQKCARGEVIAVRYADDFILGFQHRDDAERFLAALRDRMKKFNLALSDEKTRLIEFGRFAASTRKARGEGKPETFDFLGFTHICGRTQRGRFCVLRTTMAKKVRAKLKAIRVELRKRLHRPTAETGQWLHAVLAGHFQYYGVPRNIHALEAFRHHVLEMWRWTLRRRSDKKHLVTWDRMARLARRWLPRPRIVHLYPHQRLRVTTQGRSPVR